MQTEIDAKDSNCTGAEADENLVQTGSENGSDRLHDDGGQAYCIDILHRLLFQAEGGLGQSDFPILAHIVDGKQCRDMLGEDGGNRGPKDAEFGKTEEAEDQDGVEDDVHDRPGALDDHGMKCVACPLQYPFTGDVNEDGQREEETDSDVLCSHSYQGWVIGEKADEGLGEKEADDGEKDPTDRR